MTNSCTKERFLSDVSKHSIEVLKDDGVYRHLKFTNNGSQVYRFDLITWPGYLCICGDMGEQVFSRVNDMFTFFRSESDDLKINTGYWAEKSRAGEVSVFSGDMFEEWLSDWHSGFTEGWEEAQKDGLWAEIESEVFGASNEYEAYDNVSRFTSEDGHEIDCSDGIRCIEKSHHFVWRLWAIVWGIKSYDAKKGIKIDEVRP